MFVYHLNVPHTGEGRHVIRGTCILTALAPDYFTATNVILKIRAE